MFVALLRAVNVGGHNRLPMADLRAALDAVGATRVQTYLQSGNAVFASLQDPAVLEAALAEAIAARCGFRPVLQIWPGPELATALAQNPFGASDVHGVALERAADPASLAAVAAPAERFALRGRMLWLHLPDGVGRSRLAQKAAALTPGATARNLRTLTALAGRAA